MIGLASWLTAVLLKPAIVVAAGAAMAAGLRRQPAAARHAVWTSALLATLILPALRLGLPPLRAPLLADSAEVLNPSPVVFKDERALSPNYSGPRKDIPLEHIVVAIWLVVGLGLLVRRVSAELHARHIVRRAVPFQSPRFQRLLGRACLELGLHKRPVLLGSCELPAPAAIGLLRPALLLPTVAEQWDDKDLVAALVHELSHIGRRDCLFNFLADLAVIVYWVNPALLMARRRMRLESERACDDLVLSQGTEPEQYAQLLLQVARSELPLAATPMARPSHLEFRLLAVLDESVARRPLPRCTSLPLTVSGLLIALPAAALTLHRAPAADSERLPLTLEAAEVSEGELAQLRGPDSALAAFLFTGLDHIPQHPADLIRERSAWALAQAKNGRLIEPLIAALDAPEWRVRAYAAWAVAPARDARAVMPLLRQLESPIWRLRAMAAYALRESADPRAAAAMTLALHDPAWQVRIEAEGYFTRP